MSTAKLEDLDKGDLILVFWTDASDTRGSISEHEGHPEVHVKDWGIFLGVSGRKRRFLIIGKDVTEVLQDWGATRIPVNLIDEVKVIMPRDEVVQHIAEVQALTGRRVRLRKAHRGVDGGGRYQVV